MFLSVQRSKEGLRKMPWNGIIILRTLDGTEAHTCGYVVMVFRQFSQKTSPQSLVTNLSK